MDILKRADKIANQIRGITDCVPKIGMILGSGWGGVADLLEDKTVIAYSSLEDMPVCSVKGHSGNFLIGILSGVPVIIMQGRFHLYEGRKTDEVVLPVYIMKRLGIERLIITNAAGGINLNYRVGDIMVIDDHINFSGSNPLIGIKATDEKPIFIDMGGAYNADMKKIAKDVCVSSGITVHKGVYLQLSGPSYETFAEVKMFRSWGADAVGMSTAIECIFANYLGIEVLGLSCITNAAAGIIDEKLSHADVLSVSKKNESNFKGLIEGIVKKIYN